MNIPNRQHISKEKVSGPKNWEKFRTLTKTDKNGKMSQQNLWKIRKKLFPRLNVPHAVIDNYGNEVTDPFNIKTLYQSEFECYLK